MNRSMLAAAVMASSFFIAAVRPAPETYEIDMAHSYVGFTVRHLAVSNVKGKFTRFSGTIQLDDSDITKSTVHVSIDANSIDTSNERRDGDLRGAEFFNVATFPQITFAGKRVEKVGDGLVLIGDLTMRDVTKEVRIPFEIVGPVNAGNGRKRIGAEGTLRVNRHDYGLKWNRLQEAVQVVGDEVRIELNIEANTPRQRQEEQHDDGTTR